MTDKLRVLVRVDLDCATAQVAAQGHVTTKSIHGLYAVMKRANSLTAGMALELDMTRVRIEPDALEELRVCSRSHHLHAHVDPLQSSYRLSILAPDNAGPPGSNGYAGSLTRNSNTHTRVENPPTHRRSSHRTGPDDTSPPHYPGISHTLLVENKSR